MEGHWFNGVVKSWTAWKRQNHGRGNRGDDGGGDVDDGRWAVSKEEEEEKEAAEEEGEDRPVRSCKLPAAFSRTSNN